MISVIIPVYNNEDHLHICLNSILKQTYKNFEVICVDDASTDFSLDILEYFTIKDSRIKVLKNDFKIGLGYCRNEGLKEANGDYLIFLNGNDWLMPNTFELLINNAKNAKLDILFFKSDYYDEKCNFCIDELNADFSIFENQIFNHFDLRKTELFDMKKNLSNYFFLKSFVDKNEIYFPNENRINEHIPFLYKVITSANRISFINNPLCNTYKKYDLTDLNPERLFDCFDISYLVLEIFLENIQLYDYYKKEVLNYIFKDLYGKYCNIDAKFKERFFREVQNIFKNFIKNHNLYDDILMHIDENILDFFKFNEIMYKINNPPKISIIMPVFNNERDLPSVLNSIVNQTIGMDSIELIIIDDGSTDKSGEIIDNYSKKYENIIPIYLYENSGSPSKPRNIGIQNANSEYIIFHDSDDCFSLDACQMLYETMINENVDFVTGMIMANEKNIANFELVYGPWNLVLNHHDEFKNENIEKLLGSTDLFMLKINSIDENKFILADSSLNSKLLKKSLFIENNIIFPEYLNGAEDSVVLFNILINSKALVFINKVIFCYNVHREDSLTHNFSLKTIQSRPKAYQLMYDMSILNNRKDLFIELILWRKLNYWIDFHLIRAPNLGFDDILSIFKSYKNLFCECLNYSEIPIFLKNICENIKEGSFDEAVQKVMKKRFEYFNSD